MAAKKKRTPNVENDSWVVIAAGNAGYKTFTVGDGEARLACYVRRKPICHDG